jgi:hypothetical protein
VARFRVTSLLTLLPPTKRDRRYMLTKCRGWRGSRGWDIRGQAPRLYRDSKAPSGPAD